MPLLAEEGATKRQQEASSYLKNMQVDRVKVRSGAPVCIVPARARVKVVCRRRSPSKMRGGGWNGRENFLTKVSLLYIYFYLLTLSISFYHHGI